MISHLLCPIGRVTILLLLLTARVAAAEELRMFPSARLVDDPANDGDSFRVAAGGEEFVVRLYFVDCPETSASRDSMARRVREQCRHFGIDDAAKVIASGVEAKRFTDAALAEPFTVATSFAKAPSGSADTARCYAFVQTHDGRDLAGMLVAAGLARAHGVGRTTPGRVSQEETRERLRDLEASAMLKRTGVWAHSDPDHIVDLRAEQRREDEEVSRVRDEVAAGAAKEPIDLNRASREELEGLPGIGPVLAEKIVAARPFARPEDLLRVKGIGEKLLERLRDRITMGN